jgi:hypothetical protein
MNIILIAFLALLDTGPCWAAEPAPKDWISEPKTSFAETQKLPETAFAEVRITRLMSAVDELKEKSVIPLTGEMARYYAGTAFKPGKGKKSFLVRGLFANYTGKFALFWKDGQLLVEHDSLGKHFNPQFCPLIVNLPAEPASIFVVVRGDE